MLAHWNNSPLVDMSLHSDTPSWFRANIGTSFLFYLTAACLTEKLQIPILVFDWTRSELEPTIYRTRGYHGNQYTTDVVIILRNWNSFSFNVFIVKPAHAVTCIKRSHFSCPVIENFIWIEPLLRCHLSYKATFSLSQRWPLDTGLTVYT